MGILSQSEPFEVASESISGMLCRMCNTSISTSTKEQRYWKAHLLEAGQRAAVGSNNRKLVVNSVWYGPHHFLNCSRLLEFSSFHYFFIFFYCYFFFTYVYIFFTSTLFCVELCCILYILYIIYKYIYIYICFYMLLLFLFLYVFIIDVCNITFYNNICVVPLRYLYFYFTHEWIIFCSTVFVQAHGHVNV